ncbi:hypothetical protein GIS00_04940 [Nakamurella sp. YIM 132087]|uniref:Uncharacterized protein n=1 Tax=Nakamurella alba TaxID=2665158 RepID=A0A7K1FKA1_9ACTN|nr:hypothetical protein [Nakamurella alba]MTD13294.1 hypothetical protein [Nakamurella alba]
MTALVIGWWALFTQVAGHVRGSGTGERDRGDVPGWVMITVMTAITVVALLVVFRDQVTEAVTEAFDKVRQGGD